MDKIIIGKNIFWYRFEYQNKYLLYSTKGYFYIINDIILDSLILLSKNVNNIIIKDTINQKYNLNLSQSQLEDRLKTICGVFNK
jgi:hypothetical protein